jgi:transposase-like protein
MILNLTIKNLISDEQCYEQVRQLRWTNKVSCPHCLSEQVIKRGKDDTEIYRQRYE